MLSNEEWNGFIEDVCECETLSPIQKTAVLCFWYDAEMQGGGHSGYFDCYPETSPEELVAAVKTVAYGEIADNYQRALDEGEKDGYTETDEAYYGFEPSLFDCLRNFVEKNKDEILR